MRTRVLILLALAPFLLGCGGDDSGDASPDSATGTDGGGAAAAGAGDGLCGTYTALEIEQRIGIPVEDGSAAGPGGTACQWDAASEADAWVQIQVIDDTEYWEKPDLAPGYEAVPGIGSEAFVVPEMGGWKAGALTETSVAYVSMAGGSSTETTSVELLRDLLDRI